MGTSANDQSPSQDDRILVVFDVNVYLDIARLIDGPFEWEKFDALITEAYNSPIPHPGDYKYDSARAIATTLTGDYPGGRRLEVWTSDHIDLLVASKAMTELGWSRVDAQTLVTNLIADVVDFSDGGSTGEMRISYGSPPLDHEDGCVYATANTGGWRGVYYEKYCITGDAQFLAASLPGLIDISRPSQWVSKVRMDSRSASKLFLPTPRPTDIAQVAVPGTAGLELGVVSSS